MTTGDFTPALEVPPWIQGLIFDCDGTLADSLPLHYAAWEEAFAALSLPCSLEFLLRHNGKPTDLIVTLYNAEFGQTINVAEFTADKERRTYARLGQVKPLAPAAVGAAVLWPPAIGGGVGQQPRQCRAHPAGDWSA